MDECRRFFIDGHWRDAKKRPHCSIINPATEESLGNVSLAHRGDVDEAVASARRAFSGFSATSREERVALLERLGAAYMARFDDIAWAISREVGAPIQLARGLQAQTGILHIQTYARILAEYAFEKDYGSTRIAREPIGVCALITPWNWPINQICVKLIAAIAAGCTVVLKPSEVTPTCAAILAEVFDAAGVPPGVFNLIHGLGPEAGAALAAHPDVDMVSFTGSTRAGVEVGRAGAATVKRVALELGGKSPFIILSDADLDSAVGSCAEWILLNSGQSCSAPTRLLVPEPLVGEVIDRVRHRLAEAVIGDPSSETTTMGPVVSKAQWEKVQRLIACGVDEGAQLAHGGPGLPAGIERGYFVRPTLFHGVSNSMTIAREEIFGPVLCILSYRDEREAVDIANDTQYGLAGYVASRDLDRARRVASQLRCGSVYINGAGIDTIAPFGGYKQSGNGREWGVPGLEEYLEVKSMLGFRQP